MSIRAMMPRLLAADLLLCVSCAGVSCARAPGVDANGSVPPLRSGPDADVSRGNVVAYARGKWWDGARFVEDTRYVESGFFVARPRQQPEETVDLQGRFVVPPFGDAHNHMAGPVAAFDVAAVGAGVFYFMNPNVMASAAPALRSFLSRPDRVDATLSMGGITAPGGHPEKLYQDTLIKYVYTSMKPEQMVGDAFHYVTEERDIEPTLDRLVSQNADFIKIFLLFSEDYAQRKDDAASRGSKGLDPRLVSPIVAAAHRRGLRVAAHIETAADFRTIVAAGVDEAAHLPGYVALEDPIDKYVITEDDATAAAKAHIVVVTTAWLGGMTRDAKARLNAVQDMQRSNIAKLQRAGVRLILGTDGDADGVVVKEAPYLVHLGVLDAASALRLLAVDTPRYIFPERRIGALSPGYEASFIALEDDPIADVGNLAKIDRRVKQGVSLDAPADR